VAARLGGLFRWRRATSLERIDGMRRFPPSPITALVDETPRYDLGESYCRELTLGDLLSPGELAALSQVPLGYGSSAGAPELRQLIADRHGVTRDEVLLTTGAASSLFLLGLLFGDAGSEVVVVRPSFPPILDALRGISARTATVQLHFADGYRLDPTALRDALSADTRLVMLASPQNPSGVAVSREDIERTLAAMQRVCPDAFLLVDEIYRDASHGDEPTPPSVAALSPNVITCSSLSKAHGTPGLRIGWLTVRDAELYEQLRLARFNSAVSCGTLDEVLAARVLSRAEAILAPRRAFLADAVAIVEHWLVDQGGELHWVRPDAGAFCCIQLDPDAFPPARVQRFYAELSERRTVVAPGDWFGDDPRVFRLGFGYLPLDELRAGLEMITRALRASASTSQPEVAPTPG
jgi:aspartate/methionine/tyrosine aminotransferase